ncbi:MAG TPA: ParB/RepB/Spo0J family partition protein [Pseudonocardiaceae bacterium]|nr:ParB/RepB/Spo0J family partition protein [Pseudonocardiaceae bacterium]
MLEVPVQDVVAHPDNVRADVGDVDELAASVTEQGILQPLTVVGIDAYLASNPTRTDNLDAGRWVVIAGHRRLAAARLAQLATVPIIVRDDLAGAETATTTMIVENVQRAGLTPLEEARAFGRLRDTGWSQRRIAKATGVSHGQVAKRLSLLRLPDQAAETLHTGRLSVADALTLLELPDDELSEAWTTCTTETWRRAGDVVASFTNRRTAQAAAAKLRDTLNERGIEIVDNDTMFGHDAWRHRMPWGTTLADIDNPSAVVAVVWTTNAGADALYYHRTIPAPTDRTEPTTAAENTATEITRPAFNRWGASVGSTPAEDEKAARDAGTARAQACARLLAGELTAEFAAELLADALCTPFVVEGDGATAAELLGVELDDDTNAEDWLVDQGNTGGRTTIRAAIALVLADLERGLAGRGYRAHGPWTGRETRHVRRLINKTGHEPSAYELAQLAAADKAHEDGGR